MNLPNKLTMFRILLVPIIVILYLCIPSDTVIWSNLPEITLQSLMVLILFIAASITDYLDGSIARKRNLITSFGKFADPIADKLLVNTVLILLVYSHRANVVAVLIMTARDLIVDGLRLNAAAHNEVVAAGFAGKLKTVMQMVAIILLLLDNWPFVYFNFPAAQIALWIACICSVYSGFIYFQKLKKYILKSM